MCDTNFVVKHGNRRSALVFGTVQEALGFVYKDLDLRDQFESNRGADHAERLNSLLNFGQVHVYCYRIQVFHGGEQYSNNRVIKQRVA
jgi:hypothetical protein